MTSTQPGAIYQWVSCPSYTPISGATNVSYTASADGSYAVIVELGSCVDTSACQTITGVGIGEQGKTTANFVYPNPTSGMVEIDMESTYEYTITNVNGEVISSGGGEKVTQVDLSNYPDGTYIFTIIAQNEKFTTTVVKQ